MEVVLQKLQELTDHTLETADYYHWTNAVASACNRALKFKGNDWEYESALDALTGHLDRVPAGFKPRPHEIQEWARYIDLFKQCRQQMRATNVGSRSLNGLDLASPTTSRRRSRFKQWLTRKS